MFCEIRLHGRGGQGVVTAASLLAEAAMIEGYWSQAIPFFGAERRGSPVVSYVRISDKPIRIHSSVKNPNAVIVLDEKILELQNIVSDIENNGWLIVNTSKTEEILKYARDNLKIATVDATSIALEIGLIIAGWPVVNTSILGSFAKATKLITLKSLEKALSNHWRNKELKLNMRALREAYNRTKILRC